ncbi:MAG: hypothetical protein JWN48_3770 [Myxococcaceae bacterium]|nr:hypothetical protein [Myxococcaceae bacterium]
MSARWWLLPLAALVVLAARERQSLAAATVEWSDFSKAGSIYFAPGLREPERVAFRAALTAARVRVAAFYGPLRGTPVIIVADAQTLPRFTDVSTAVTYYQPHRAVIVVGPAGQSVDVVAHELAHAELYGRVGYRVMEWCVPRWLDEGLAVQFDDRPFYSEQELERHIAEGWRMPSLQDLGSRAGFFAGTRAQVRFHYAAARHAVGEWLRQKGRAQAITLLETLSCSDRWYEELARGRQSPNVGSAPAPMQMLGTPRAPSTPPNKPPVMLPGG